MRVHRRGGTGWLFRTSVGQPSSRRENTARQTANDTTVLRPDQDLNHITTNKALQHNHDNNVTAVHCGCLVLEGSKKVPFVNTTQPPGKEMGVENRARERASERESEREHG